MKFNPLRHVPIMSLLFALSGLCADDYTLGPDSQFHPDVPHGTVTKRSWTHSAIFPGTARDYWVYVPAQYDPAKPACVMVFQDGGSMAGTNGSYRVPLVLTRMDARFAGAAQAVFARSPWHGNVRTSFARC